jgi:transposase
VQCKGCRHAKSEQLDFLTDNPFYTERFAYYVGRRCRQATIKDVAEEFRLHWETIKTLEMQYMRAQLAKAGTPAPKAIGIDEISIRKGHTYRIVVSDLIRGRPGPQTASRAFQRTTSTGTVARVSTLFVWEPMIIPSRPRRPCEAIRMRSQRSRLAVSMMFS